MTNWSSIEVSFNGVRFEEPRSPLPEPLLRTVTGEATVSILRSRWRKLSRKLGRSWLHQLPLCRVRGGRLWALARPRPAIELNLVADGRVLGRVNVAKTAMRRPR